jgi:acyl carrier protein
MDWTQTREHLAVFNSPTYSRLPQDDGAQSGEAALIDIKGLLAQKTPAEVSKLVADEITEQIARVLRLPREDVARNKPLAEIGLDSLMAMELALALEQRFGLNGPFMSSASGLTVLEVADHVIAVVTDSIPEQDRQAKTVIVRHLEANFDPTTLIDMKEQLYEKLENRKDILS